MIFSSILSIIFFSISQLSSFIFCSSSSLRLISHKTNPGVAAVVAASKQEEEEELMDEWAPYRMAFLLILVASSVALWASYKLLCEHPDDNEELQQQSVIAYQPLRQNCNQLVLSLEGGGRVDDDDQHKPFKTLTTKTSLSFSSSSSSFDDEDDDLTCLLVGNGEITGTKLTASTPTTATTTRLKKGLLSTGNI